MRWTLLFAVACTNSKVVVDETVSTPTPTVDSEVDTEVVEPEPPSDPCLAQPTELVLGQGEVRFGETALTFEALEEGADVYLRPTPAGQPAWYIPFTARIRNTTQTVVVRQQMFRVADDQPLSHLSQMALLLIPEAGTGEPWACHGAFADARLTLDIERYGLREDQVAPWEELCGEEVRVHTEVLRLLSGLDDLQLLVADDHRVRMQPDPCDCASCGAETPACVQEGTEVCHETLFLPTCERPEGYCGW